MEDISFEEVEKLKDFNDILEVATRYGVPLEGCDSAEEWVERITLHKQKACGQHKALLDPTRYENQKKENQEKREAICRIFETIQSSFEGNFPFLSSILKCREISNDLSADFQDYIDVLKKGECNIVVAGQTSSGKSTFLNLLLGMDVLPRATLSCTSSICKLRYGRKFKVKVTENGKVEENVYKNPEELNAHLEKVVAVKNIYCRETGNVTPEVEISLPSDILMSGVTIVDTPGFGEYEAMDNLLKDFVTSSRVAAFVYVIKTDSAGGVQEDRLVRFLQALQDHNRTQKQQQTLNPRAAVFVCNRWDQIGDNEKHEVKVSVLEKLNDVWPSLGYDQVCFFSTTKAKVHRDIDKDYITKELHQLLQSLNGLSVLAQQDIVRKSYEWLKSVVKECTISIKTILSQLALTDTEHERNFNHARKQLERLQTRADDTVVELKEELKEAGNSLKRKMDDIISSQRFLKQMADWNFREIPLMPSTLQEWEEMKITLDTIIVNKVFKIFDSTAECQMMMSDSDIIKEIQGRLRLLDEEMEKISSGLEDNSFHSLEYCDSSGRADDKRIVVALLNKRNSRSIVNRIRSSSIMSDTKPLTPRAFICRAVAPIIEKVASEKFKLKRTFSVKSKTQMMEQRTHKVLSAMKEDDSLMSRFVGRYTEKHMCQIESITSNIPTFIHAKETLMEEIITCRKKTRRNRGELKKVMECLEPQKELLRGFGYLHINDFASDDIHLLMDDARVRSSSQINVGTFLQSSQIGSGSTSCVTQGLWTAVQKAELMTDSEKVPVMLKTYTGQSDTKDLFKEIAKLRCLEHKFIAPFLGMTHTNSEPAFVFDTHMISARRYLRRGTTNVREAVPVLLSGLVEGLEVLHRDELVHMELSLDTVLVTDLGEVKLCNMCLPRKCNFPSDMETIEAADFTCLSPKALKGGVYSHEDDVYSLGVLIYEVQLRMKPYGEQREWKLSRFVSEVNPAVMLKLGELDLPEVMSDLLRGCLVKGRTLRLPLVRIKHMLKALSVSQPSTEVTPE